MKKTVFNLLFLALAVLVAAPPAVADEGNWLVRVRALYLSPADKSDAIPGKDGLPADAITVSSKTFPEVDISYFFSPNFAVELVLTYPQEHDVEIEGVGKLGTFKHLPPTLSAQYHFMPDARFRPYIGAGLNYTFFSSVDLGEGVELDDSSFGYALGAGFDVKAGETLFINFDVKKVSLGTDVTVDGVKLTHLDVDPWLISAGVGFRF